LCGDRYSIKTDGKWKKAGLNKALWFGDIGVRIAIKDQYTI